MCHHKCKRLMFLWANFQIVFCCSIFRTFTTIFWNFADVLHTCPPAALVFLLCETFLKISSVILFHLGRARIFNVRSRKPVRDLVSFRSFGKFNHMCTPIYGKPGTEGFDKSFVEASTLRGLHIHFTDKSVNVSTECGNLAVVKTVANNGCVPFFAWGMWIKVKMDC